MPRNTPPHAPRTPDPRPGAEREITSPVTLCRPDGRLDHDAVGWTRTPLHDTSGIAQARRGRGRRGWGRNKRWEYWAVMTPTHVVALTLSDIDYAGVHDLWVLERATGREISTPVVVPFARGVRLPARIGAGPARAHAHGLDLAIDEVDGGTRLRGRTARVELDVHAARPAGHECLGVVVPWSDRLFQYTVKDVARPATGRLTVDGVPHQLPAGSSWAVLDHGRGRWPYRMRWHWGAGSGVHDGHVIGVQLGGRWTDGTGSTENALLVDGRLHKNSDELVWEHHPTDLLAPWRVHGPHAELRFVPFHDRVSHTDLLVVAQDTHQCFGAWEGWMTDSTGRRVTFTGIEGWAEDVRNRW
ncbi:DUF2804 domain-containing protein [Cellulomonas soli]|uniref:DUF2804 domain-containing protein n=1 Tax=Cellulomonas soli TaxID=931535 RepID=UPI003F84E28E